jgi:glutamate/tyrosine decarboxylase-like PLP-dependent enzyme
MTTPDSRVLPELLEDAAKRSIRYLTEIESRSVAPAPAAIANLSRFHEPLPAGPTDPAAVLRMLDELGSPATMAMGSGRFFGFVIGGKLPVTIASNWLTTAWDQNTSLWNVTPATVELEEVALGWLVELLGLPPGTGAGFVTGATVANFTALAAARHVVLERAGWDVEANGLFGAPPITVVVGAEAHPTLIKSLGLLGLGRKRVVTVPVDGQGRMRADQMPKLEGPAIVCVQAGNINTGAFDPFDALIAHAHAANAWVHVDGAFGLWATVAPTRAPLAHGMEHADSWATDAHKWLNVPYDSGLAFVRDVPRVRAAMAITAEYLPSESPRRNTRLHARARAARWHADDGRRCARSAGAASRHDRTQLFARAALRRKARRRASRC